MRKTAPQLVLPAVALCLLAASLAGQAGRDAGPSFPPTPAGKSAQSFLEAFNTGDPARLERFFAEHIDAETARRVPPADRAARLMELRRELGRVTVRRVDAPKPEAAAMILQGERGRMVKLTLEFGPAPDHFLKGMGLDEAGPEDLAGPLPPLNRVEALASIEQDLGRLAAADEFSGVVLIARRGNPTFLKAWGLASREFGAPNRTTTKFNLGSINKIFTRIAVSQLIEKGKLSLDDTLGRILPDYPNKDAADKVTIRQLITMRSGIGDFFGPKFVQTPKDVFRSNADFLPMFAGQPLAFEPGTQEQYSNGGYAVLGEVIARVSGMDYYEYVRKNIFGPAGMTSTDSFEADAVVPDLAEGYTRNWDDHPHQGEPRRRNIYTRPARGSAAGGGYSTAEDLARFAEALASNRLLSPAYTAWLFSGVEPAAGGRAPQEGRAGGGLGIAGGAPGINAVLDLEPATGAIVIVLANDDPPTAVNAAKMIRRYLAAVRN